MKQELLKISEGTVVWCPTNELAEKVLKIVDALGFRWNARFSFLEKSYWNIEKEQTCYNFFKGSYACKDYYERNRYSIIHADDFLKLHEGEPTISLRKLSNGVDIGN